MKSFAMIRFHALGPWITASAIVALFDLFLPPVAAICVLQVVIQMASFRRLHARRVAMLTALLVLATVLPGLLRLFVSVDESVANSYSDVMFAPIRVWVSIALGVAMLFQTDLQRVRKRRLELRRQLQRKVRRRSAQITRINEALRREVARRQATQNLLTRTETHLQSLAQRMQLQVLRKDCEGVITYANDAFCKGVGRKAAEVIGSTDFDLYPPATAEKYRQDDAHVMHSGIPVDHVESHPTSDGKTSWVQVFKAPEYNEHAECIGIQMVFWDVTDTYRRTAELRRSEARKRALFDAAREAVMLVDKDGRIVEANPSAELLFGGGHASLAGCLLDSVAVPDSSLLIGAEQDTDGTSPVNAESADLLSSRSRVARKTMRWQELPASERREMTVRLHNGMQFPAEISVHPIPLENAQGLAVFVRDVTLRHQAIRALRNAKRVAEEANRTKSEFMAGVSHEIRTPLGGILGSAALLAQMELPVRAKQYVDMIRQSGDLLAGVIGDILDFASIEAGRFNIDPSPTHLHQCVGEAFRCLATRASGKDLELVLAIAPEVPRQVSVDAKRLRQIVINLAGNAIKFTPRGHVMVKMSLQTDAPVDSSVAMVVIEVIDSGIGIAPEMQKTIFKPFEQGDSGTTRRYGGTGLGLSISSQLVNHMGGRIEVSSLPGQGSTFRCMLPLPAIPDENRNEISVEIPTESSPPLLAAKSFSATVDAVPLSKTVAVDIQHPVQRSAISDLLLAHGYQLDANASLRIADHLDEQARAIPAQVVKDNTSDRRLNESQTSRMVWLTRVDETQRVASYANECVLFKPVIPDDLLHALEQPLVNTVDSDETLGQIPSANLSQERTIETATLLVVDDSEVNRTVIHDFLALAGYRADVVSSGAAAILATGKRDYDCILMDLQMPEMDGIETTRQIGRQCRDLGRTAPPVIALTAHATQEHRSRCLNAGMKSFLVKPIESSKLINEIVAVTGKLPSATHYESLPHNDGAAKTLKPWQRKMLAAAGNDEETLQALAEAFLLEVPQLCESLTKSLAEGDAKTARRAAHTLKSCLKYVAPTEDHQLALDIEMAAGLNDLTKARRIAPQAIAIAEKWVQQVNAHYGSPD